MEEGLSLRSESQYTTLQAKMNLNSLYQIQAKYQIQATTTDLRRKLEVKPVKLNFKSHSCLFICSNLFVHILFFFLEQINKQLWLTWSSTWPFVSSLKLLVFDTATSSLLFVFDTATFSSDIFLGFCTFGHPPPTPAFNCLYLIQQLPYSCPPSPSLTFYSQELRLVCIGYDKPLCFSLLPPTTSPTWILNQKTFLLSARSLWCYLWYRLKLLVIPDQLLRLQTIKTIVNSRRFKGSSSDEPRRVQVLNLYCLTRFENENSRRGDVY